MNYGEKDKPVQMSIVLPTVNAGTSATFAIFNPSMAGEIVSVNISNHAALGRDANSYTTLTLVDNTTTTHTLATYSNSTAATSVTLAADTFQTFVLAATNTNKRFNIGDAIVLVKTDTGAGSTITTPTLWIEWIPGTYDS